MFQTIKRWQDPEYKREYFRNYYHQHKVKKNMTRDIDWTDTEAVKQFKREYYHEKKENLGKYVCEVCRIEVNTIHKHRHEATQRHKNAIVLLEKLALKAQFTLQ